jgi:hypothetical protein
LTQSAQSIDGTLWMHVTSLRDASERFVPVRDAEPFSEAQ